MSQFCNLHVQTFIAMFRVAQTELKCNWFYRNCLANDGNTSTLSGFSNSSTRSSLKQNWKMTLQSREILIVALKLSIACWKCFIRSKEFDKNFSKWNQYMYHKIASSNTSRLRAHVGLFRLLMKGIFGSYVLWPFDKNYIFLISDAH